MSQNRNYNFYNLGEFGKQTVWKLCRLKRNSRKFAVTWLANTFDMHLIKRMKRKFWHAGRMDRLDQASSQAANIRNILSLSWDKIPRRKMKSFTKSPCVNNLKGYLKNIDLKLNISLFERNHYFAFLWGAKMQPNSVANGLKLTIEVNEILC